LGLRYRGDDEPEEAKGGPAQRWADRPVAAIDGHDIWSTIDEARRVAIPGITARNRDISDSRGRALLAALSSMFSWLKLPTHNAGHGLIRILALRNLFGG
jgi:hypothetical protein